jgi:Terminase large subunit, T4likevirus-type, N-terminal/Terminase RNaseH-like domain
MRLQIKNTFRDNPKLKKLNVNIQFTKHQTIELKKCSDDPIYFINNYVQIVTLDEGIQPFKIWQFQKELIQLIHNERFVIVKMPRQTGKTTTVVGYLLWLTIFCKDQNILIAANKKQTACDILSKYKTAYELIPIWLQQGVETWNDGDIALENGSKIRGASTTSGTARSGSYNFLLLDEFAHITPKLANDFYQSVYPVISSGKKTKIIMISTPKGLNLFYKFWSDAKNKKNNFIPFEVTWRDVPGRDEEWYEVTLANIGEQKFQVEYECSFLGSSNTLINGIKLEQLIWEDPIEIKGVAETEIAIYEKPIKEYFNHDEERVTRIEHKYVIVVDPSEGKKLDYSAFSVIDITQTPYKQVATYYSNTISPILLPSIIYDAARYYNDALVLVELQSTGIQIADILIQDLEYENVLRTHSGNKRSQTLTYGYVKGSIPGVKTSGQVKRIGCANLKTLIEMDQLIIKDYNTKEELSTFVLNNTGSYAAESDADSDDLVMTLVLFGWLTTQKYFKELVTHDLRKQLQKTILNYDEETILPMPIIDDGLNPNLEKWGGSLWINMNMENSYTDPYSHIISQRKNIRLAPTEEWEPWQKGDSIPNIFSIGGH